MAEGKFVSYLRVSTQRQGTSGLGVEAQRKAVLDYLNGGRHERISEYVETESGTQNDRPELEKALSDCRLYGATLVVARLDRFSRNAAFILNKLEDAKVRFVAADMPGADHTTVGVIAVVAQSTAKAISNTTKQALAAAKARGTKLGVLSHKTQKDCIGDEGRKRGNATANRIRAERANLFAQDVASRITDMRTAGKVTLREIADALTEQKVRTPRGTPDQPGIWTATAVKRILARLPKPSVKKGAA